MTQEPDLEAETRMQKPEPMAPIEEPMVEVPPPEPDADPPPPEQTADPPPTEPSADPPAPKRRQSVRDSSEEWKALDSTRGSAQVSPLQRFQAAGKQVIMLKNSTDQILERQSRISQLRER